jgi:nicotinamidase/pyrazinamidase
MNNLHLLVIDPQNDFCSPNGSLYVPGAEKDMSRLATMIRNLKSDITHITCTLDSHHLMSIFHPIFWRDANNQLPAPYTTITAESVQNGSFRPLNGVYEDTVIDYLEALEEAGKYKLMIWPPHCLIGSPGHNVFPELYASFLEWEEGCISVNYVNKGSNTFTENYSVFKAEVPVPGDKTTELNKELIKDIITTGNTLLIAGEATNFCVQSSVMDLVNNISKEQAKKIIILTDAMSPVPIPGYKEQVEKFFGDLKALGVQFSTTEELMCGNWIEKNT